MVGELEFQDAITAIAERCPDRGPLEDSAACRVTARLVPNPEAIGDYRRVRVEIDGATVGYLDDSEAHVFPEPYRRLVAIERPTTIAALIVGGWDRGNGETGYYGVRLSATAEEEA